MSSRYVVVVVPVIFFNRVIFLTKVGLSLYSDSVSDVVLSVRFWYIFRRMVGREVAGPL